MVQLYLKVKNKEGWFKKFYLHKFIYCSQIWLNLLVDRHRHFGYYITKLTSPPQKKKKNKQKTLDTKNHGPNNNRPGADVLSAPVWEKQSWNGEAGKEGVGKGGGDQNGVQKLRIYFSTDWVEFAAASTRDKWLHYLRGMDVNSGADVPPRLRHGPLLETGGAEPRIPIPWERSSSLHLFLSSLYLLNCELLFVYFSRCGL
jgi:hypothetical protein